MKLSIVVSTQPASFSALAYKGKLEANLKKIATLGYDGVELAIRDPKSIDPEYLSATLADNNLEVPAIGTGQAFAEEGFSFTSPKEDIREASIHRIKAQIDFATHFEATIIIGLIRGTVEEPAKEVRAQEWLQEALEDCAKYASLENVTLAIEPINRYETNLINTVAEGLALLEKVGSESLGLLLDTFHMNIEEPSIEESVRMADERIFHFHVADSNRWYPGAGHIDFGRVVDVLHQIGYDGYLSAEILPLPDSDTCAKKTIDFMNRTLTVLGTCAQP